MQLLIILALLLYGGKSNAGKIFAEVKPVLESIGGEEMKEAIKNAEELSRNGGGFKFRISRSSLRFRQRKLYANG